MHRLLFSALMLFTGLSLPAQVYNVTRYSTDAGLLQSQVMAIMQDQWGYLWLGTHRGVARFDGKQFKNYLTDDGLTGNFLADLMEDQAGNIWMATDNGLSRYNGRKFTNFTVSDSVGLEDNDILCLLQDQAGTIWLGTKSRGLAKFEAGQFIHNPYPWKPVREERSVYVLLEDSKQRFWLGTNEGLFLRDPAGTLTRLTGLPANTEVFSLLEAHDGRLWLGTNQGAWRFDGLRFEAMKLGQNGSTPPAVYCLVQDAEGHLWLGTGKGIIRYHDGRFDPMERNDRSLDYIMRSALVDDEGNLWFGTDGGGLRKITEGIFETYNMQSGMSSNLAKSFLEDERGRIWVSTKDRGINLMDDGQVVRQYTVADGLGGNDIVFSYEDSQGDFWFTSYNGTLTRYDGRFKVFSSQEGLACNSVFCVTQAPDGQLWVGTDVGIFRYDGRRFRRHLNKETGLIDNTVYAIIHDRRGQVWIGTSTGMTLIRANGEIAPFDLPEVVGNNVITLLEDSSGRVWAGSSLGLALFEPGAAQPRKIPISNTPGAHTVVGLVLEQGRFLWVATENGAYRLDLQRFSPADERHKFEHYAQKDGLPSLECNANAVFEDEAGNIWIGTIEGAIMRPAGTHSREEGMAPRVYLTNVRAARDTSWQAMGFEVNERGLPQNLVLPYTDNRIDFEFIGISLKSPGQVEYRFMLEGVDDGWLRPTRQTSVFYPNLPPGSYTFMVQATRESNNWQDSQTATFSFVIRPPFWQTWWFISLASLALLGLGAVTYRNVTARRRRINEEKHIRHTAERLRLEHQALYAMMNPHFTFNALQSIQFFIHRQDKKAANKFLSSFAKLVRKNLESTKSEFISLGEEIERLKLYLSLEKMRFPEKFDYKVKTDPFIDLTETQLPPMLLQPFVENSIKHGIMPLDKDGEIVISIEQEDEDHLRILIRDNGIGVSASRERRADRPSDHVSKGMQITRDRLALFARMTGKRYQLDIRELTNEQGEVGGTEVSMLLPLKQVI